MQNNHKKESFKLLQLSDDSKSLTELDLPPVTHQRKRKILRKTRNTSPHSRLGGHHAHDASTSSDGLMVTACSNNVALWAVTITSCGWLCIISYMIATVYAENLRLQSQMSNLVASSQMVPDELQRWHESSKWLELNQTAALVRLSDVEQRIVGLDKDLQAIRVEFKQKYDDSSDHEKVTMLQTNVADFGAQLKDIRVGVNELKGTTQALRTGLDQSNEALHKLDETVHAANSTTSGADSPTMSTDKILHIVHNVTDEIRDLVDHLNVTLHQIEYKVDQQNKNLEEDLRSHKTKLDLLTENLAKLYSQVGSIENSLKHDNFTAADNSSRAAAQIQTATTVAEKPLATPVPTLASTKERTTTPFLDNKSTKIPVS